MSTDSAQLAKSLLMELYQTTNGDTEKTVSMYDLGAGMGLSRAEAGSAAEELMVSGLAELRTLSGGISITAEGLSTLGIVPVSSGEVQTGGRGLGGGPLLDQDDRETLKQLVDHIRSRGCGDRVIGDMEEIVVDLKTLEVQLLSPAAKTAIVREVLRSLHNAFERFGEQAITALLQRLLA